MTIWESAASTDSLRFAFYGTALTLPMIAAYTVFVYRVFAGKTAGLSYE